MDNEQKKPPDLFIILKIKRLFAMKILLQGLQKVWRFWNVLDLNGIVLTSARQLRKPE